MDPSYAEQFVDATAERTSNHLLVPVAGVDRVTLHALGFVLSLLGERWPNALTATDGHALRPDLMIEAVHVTEDREPEPGCSANSSR